MIAFNAFGKTDYQNVAVMVSGGRTSHYLAKRMIDDAYWRNKNLGFAFANTGKEAEATLEFVNECDQRMNLGVVWVEAAVNPEYGKGTSYRVVNFKTASRNGEPFEAVIQKYGISNVNFPHCTRELKAKPLNAYFRDKWGGNWAKALGFRFDELRRVKPQDKVVYPLVPWMVTIDEVRRFWNEQVFDLKLKDYQGNCDLCWKKSLRKKLTVLKETPAVADWWAQMESKYGLTEFERRQNHPEPVHFNRDDVSVLELLALSKKPFIPVTDPYWKNDQSNQMDDESPCSCMRQDDFSFA